ncbi:hypothetical protein [Pengzhenrongella frigida]|uniref:Heavy metal transporter n=1 Tax=Pengzhenrongella frigida TaxID=1259133 RepID=A0A4Q5N1M5_9MICO|nr:hypothetical protein [Cellulomonas sp. HLT2-17]RYV51990.1 hypothetical protein EUA98_05300 [Cellulomonas sp. HLT2-17]
MSRRRRRRSWRTALALLATAAIAVTAVVALLNQVDGGDVRAERCAAEADGTSWYLTPAQADNAALVAAVSVRRGMPARAATIGIATALQESKLLNIDYGDRDSVGLFQQRPSQGWGTVEQILDPVYSANAFFDGLDKVPDYEALEITVAAQEVQRSGFPEAYAQHETRSRAWASALTGYSPATVTCDLHTVGGPGSTEAVAARVARDFGAVPTTSATDDDGTVTVTIDGGALGAGTPDDDTRLAWTLAHWSVAVAHGLDVDAVSTADQTWSRDEPTWSPSGTDPVPAGEVHLTLATQ